MRRGTYRDRSGWTAYPNSRWEDPRLDTFDKVIAGWLMSHADGFVAGHISRHEIADRLDIDPARVTKSLKRLAALGIVTMTAGQRGRMVIEPCVDVWEQPLRLDGIPTGDRVENQPVTERKTNRSADPHLPMGEEQGEQQGERRIAPLALITFEARREAWFEGFWRRYPRRVGKPPAKRAFMKACVDEATAIAMAHGLDAWIAHWAERGEVQFIPHPATWLNRRQWEDEPPSGGVAAVPRGPGGGPRPLTKMERAYQRRTDCTDDEARAWWARQRSSSTVVDADVVAGG